MPTVEFYQDIRINITGYDRHPAMYGKGTHDVPASVAEFVRANPSVGIVRPAKPAESAATKEAPKASTAPKRTPRKGTRASK